MRTMAVEGPLERIRRVLGIASILTLCLVFLIAVLMAVITMLDIQRERTGFYDNLEQRGAFLGSGLTEVFADHLYHARTGELVKTADRVISSLPDIESIRVFRSDGSVLVDRQGQQKNADYVVGTAKGPVTSDPVDGEYFVRSYEGDSLLITSPLEVDARVSGTVQFAFDQGPLNGEIMAILLERAWQSSALIALGAALAYLISHEVTQPLKTLAVSPERIGDGNLEEPVPVPGGKETKILGNALEHMRVELRELYGGLETKVAQRTQEISNINQDLEKEIEVRKLAEEELARHALALEVANRELEAFSYSVSHDLRAPLRSINGFSQALLDDCADELGETGKDYLHRVRASSERMSDLIDDLLQLSRITRSEMKQEEVDLSAIAGSIATEVQRSQPERQVHFDIAKGLADQGDERLLLVVLENLINNSWKFTAKQPQGNIEFGAERCNGVPAYFIRDNGAGFDMAFSGKLFGAFQRLHPASEFEGTGVGLAIVQRVIHRHGGQVWAEGAVGEGATFYFTLKPQEEIGGGRKTNLIGGRQSG